MTPTSPDHETIGAEIDRIRSLGPEPLRREWHRLHHSEPPRISRDLLVRAIGYRLQELEHGGLGKTTRRKLKTLAKLFRTTGRIGPGPVLSLKPAESQSSAQFRGTFSRRKPSVASANWAQVA